jgi:hypothetical protein
LAESYPNSGALWTPKFPKKHDKAPDLRGDLKIDADLISELMLNAEDGVVTIKLDGWKRRDSNGNHMVSIKVDTYKPQQARQVNDPWDD